MGTAASVDAESDGIDEMETARERSSPGHDHVWKKVQAIQMAAKGFKILRPGRKLEFRNVVVINKSGFSVSTLTIVAGEVVMFVWDDPESNGYNVIQVIHDGEQFRPVPGGASSGPVTKEGYFEYLFQIEGEYKFFSSGLRCTPLTVHVAPRADIQVELSEHGFMPNIIHIERGNTVKWQWQTTSVPISMCEVQYCFRHSSTLDPADIGNIIATTAGNFKKQFKQEGIYYFQSQSNDQTAKSNFCLVHVKEIHREHIVDILDTMFSPPILLAEEGDKVWWRWGKDDRKKPHCLYQIHAPDMFHQADESFVPIEGGFRWPHPTKGGLMAHSFSKCGVYYYSDYNLDEAAEYLGTIIVKPKQTDYVVDIGQDGFTPDLLRIMAGDRVWWRWRPRDLAAGFSLVEVEKCLCANQRTPVSEFDCKNQCKFLEDEAMRIKTMASLDTVQLNSVGVYHYRIADSPNSVSTSSIIVQPGPRNYTVHVSDLDFDPKVLSINVGDRVWWVWQGTKNQHNIMQVSHQGRPILDGFCSGSPLDAPSACVHQFTKSGVYYYVSKNIPKFFGAVVVSLRPKVNEVTLTPQAVDPDPVDIRVNDVVCWTFTGLRQNDVDLVTSPNKLMDLQASDHGIAPRRCLSRLFQAGPMQHFFSRSFWRGGKRDMNKAEMEARLSTVIIDEPYDCPVVRVSSRGFFPPTINIQKGQSVLWTWKDSDEEAHNVIYVSPPKSETPLSVIQGAQSFNSGKPVPSNSFLHTFDDVGIHCVASQGAPGYAGVIQVLASDEKTSDPLLISDKLAGIVDQGHVVVITCETPDSRIYYTIDGTTPEPYSSEAKPYNPERGVVLRQPGFHIIRAIAVCDSLFQSNIVHSQRFWVLPLEGVNEEFEEEMMSEAESFDETDAAPDAALSHHLWLSCQPKIKSCFTGPGIAEVFWEPFSPEIQDLIRGYQVYLNEVIYCDLFSSNHNSLNMAGMAGGRDYDVYLEVFPNDDMLMPNKSNHLLLRVPITNNGGGPLISLEASDDQQTMVIVWMSISTPEYPVAGYKLYLNGKQCGNMVVPDEDSDRCKVVIEECSLDFVYRVAVLAVPDDSNQKPRLSNQLELSLPLETYSIVLPPEENRQDDPDMYNEYVEIREGSGYLPDMEVDEDGADASRELTNQLSPVQEEMTKTELPKKEMSPPDLPSIDGDDNEISEKASSLQDGAADGAAESRELTNQLSPVQEEMTKTELPTKEMSPPDLPSIGGDDNEISEKASSLQGPFVEVMESESTPLQSSSSPPLPIEAAVVVHTPKVDTLPAPKISIQPASPESVQVEWECARPHADYKCTVYVVNVVGAHYRKHVNSDISFECNQEIDGEQVACVQHSWNVTDGKSLLVRGLVPGEKYWTHVVAHYSPIDGSSNNEIQVKSSTLRYTTLGAPTAPQPLIQKIHQYQVELGWTPAPADDNSVEISGYIVLCDGKPMMQLKPDNPQIIVDFVKPGETKTIQVVATTNHDVGNSPPSAPIQICCPNKPPAPIVSQQPSYKKGCVVIGWEKPRFVPMRGEEIVLYTIYVDEHWHGEVKSMMAADNNGYQYYLSDLTPGMTYDVTVKTVSGQLKAEAMADRVFCLSESSPSNTVTITCPAPPESPVLRIEGMTSEGVDVTWLTPQQFGDAQISGYQILKNGKLYGSTIPADVQSLRIKDVTLGEKISLQLVALTEHPVGRNVGGIDTAVKSLDADSGIDGASHHSGRTGDAVVDKYGACKAGPKLTFHYTGLVQAPNKVWCETVTGHSALIVWTKDDKIRPHYIAPDNYQVTWWPGEQPEEEINSQHTSNHHLEITGLKPATVYTVVVEARKLQSYSALQEEEGFAEEEGSGATYILTSLSEKLTVRLARPPDPPSNLGILASTCHSLQVAWDPPREHGVEVIGIRVDCYPVSKLHCNPATILELLSDVTSCTVEGLCENTEHIVTVTAITDEFFDCLPEYHPLKKVRSLRADVKELPESPWLPRSSILATTSGTDPPSQLSLVKSTMDSVTLSWKPAIVHGSNRLLGQVVRWSESSRSCVSSARWNSEEIVLASHMTMNAHDSHVTVKGLDIGAVYQFIVEAVVSVKTAAEREVDFEGEARNRRTAHVPSKPLVVRTRAPCEAPKLYVSAFTQNTIQIFWEKPLLYTVLDPDTDDKPKILRRHLEGYQLFVNGKNHMRLLPTAQSCTLTKCRPGKRYDVVIVALTCTEEAKHEKRRKLRGMSADSRATTLSPSSGSASKDGHHDADDEDVLDQAASDPLHVTIPRAIPGNIATFRVHHVVPSDSAPESTIHAAWSLNGEADNVRQYNLTWYSHMNPVINKKAIGSDQAKTNIAVNDKKSVYELAIEPQMFKEQTKPEIQNLQVVVPGPPDPPELFLRNVSQEEFVVEWGEPRCFGHVKVMGYQMYLNDRKVGSALAGCHYKAVVPCQAHRTYKVNLVALSDTEGVADSPKSNTLFVSTHDDGRVPETNLLVEELASNSDMDGDFSFKVLKTTESSIDLDWSSFVETEEVTGYRVEWSSLAQPAQREARLGVREQSCTISKCFPGTNHFVRVLVLGPNGDVIDKSRLLTVQTSAPPDTPVVHVRAVNFKYIAIQWEKPQTYGDATLKGYKIFVNGIIADEVAPSQRTYSFTKGRPCLEYAFQVQALSTDTRMNSKPSEPLLVTWPGAKAPILKRAPTVSSNSVRVTWERPDVTEGVKCKHCKLHGSNDVIRSEPISVEPLLTPDPPQIAVTVVGLEERRQIEKIMCDLLNKRDYLHAIVHSKSHVKSVGDAEVSSKANQKLTHIESMIEDCFTSLNHYTGHLMAHVSWQCPQVNPQVQVCGYKVLVDGKQYGCSLHSGIRNVRIKLNLSQPIHRLSLVAVAEKPYTTSLESNIVELLTEPFQPFAFFCFHNIHKMDSRYPAHGCCQYQCSYRAERRPAARPINLGFSRRRQAPPLCQARDLFDGEFRPLVLPSRRPTVLLFWTRWCLASNKTAQFFNRFARENPRINNYTTVACGPAEDPIGERQQLIHTMMENGWRDDTVIKHFTSQTAGILSSAADYTADDKLVPKKRIGRRDADSSSITKLYNIQGVPTIVVIHPDNYVAYQGRHCAFEYSVFEQWLKSVLAAVTNEDGDNLDVDFDLDLKGYANACRSCDSALIHTPEFPAPATANSGYSTPKIRPSSYHSPPRSRPKSPIKSRPSSSRPSTRASSSRRPISAAKQRRDSDKISVSVRPFSATSTGKVRLHQKNPYVNPFYTLPAGHLSDRKAWET